MDKIKQVFSHEKAAHETGSTTGTNTGASNVGATQTPTQSAAGDRTSVGNDTSAASRTARTAESELAGNRTAETATTGTGATSTTGSRTTGSTGGAVGRGMEHVREHAAPPPHKHHQPGRDQALDEREAKSATHDHQHLAPVTHERRHHHEVEEVERQREVDRHVHHVQHHVQPVLDEQHKGETRHEKNVPVTEINERHVATDEDKAQFASLGKERDTFQEAPREKTIVDRGEQVHENTHHHVHHVVQPEIERDTHEHHRIHTTVPIHERVEEAPVVHQSVKHEALPISEFTKNGGDLNSTRKHDASLLDQGECERTVDGPAESLTRSLGLSSGNNVEPNRETRV
ncbi:hypothetical protein JCM10049v2_003815 [Rhodotorula toruloides]